MNRYQCIPCKRGPSEWNIWPLNPIFGLYCPTCKQPPTPAPDPETVVVVSLNGDSAWSDRGVVGRTLSCSSCPLAVYLKRHKGNLVVVRSDKIIARFGRKIETVAHTATTREFIGKFDNGAYPDLEAKEC